VLDEEDRQAELAVDPADDLHDLHQLFRVHPRRRLVQEEDAWLRCQSRPSPPFSAAPYGRFEDDLIREVADAHPVQEANRLLLDPGLFPVAGRRSEEGPNNPYRIFE